MKITPTTSNNYQQIINKSLEKHDTHVNKLEQQHEKTTHETIKTTHEQQFEKQCNNNNNKSAWVPQETGILYKLEGTSSVRPR